MSQQQLFAGSNRATTTTRKPVFTGLNVFKFLGLNPTKEQIEEWTGSEYKLTVDYSIRDVNERRVRPIEIWLQSVDGYIKAEYIRFLIGMDDDVNKTTGSVRYVNVVGEFCQGKTNPSENPKMEWFTKHPYRIAKVGEYELYSFMQKMMRYNSRDENANFMADAERTGVTIENLFDGNYAGLNTFFEWTAANDNKIVLLAAVRRSEKIDENGNVKHYENQLLVNNPEYFFSTSTNEVNSRSFKAITDAMDKGRRVTTSLFTIYFQEFKEEDCVNRVPSDTATPQTDAPVATTFGNWLKK